MNLTELQNKSDFNPMFIEILYYNNDTKHLYSIMWEEYDPIHYEFRGYLIRQIFNQEYKDFLISILEKNIPANYTIINLDENFKNWINNKQSPHIYFENYGLDLNRPVNEISLIIPSNGFNVLLHTMIDEGGAIFNNEGEEKELTLINTSREHLALNCSICNVNENKEKEFSLISLINEKALIRTLKVEGFGTDIVKYYSNVENFNGWFDPQFNNDGSATVKINTAKSTVGALMIKTQNKVTPIDIDYESIIGREIVIKILTDNFYLDIKLNTLKAFDYGNKNIETNNVSNSERSRSQLNTQYSYVNPGVGKIYFKNLKEWFDNLLGVSRDKEHLKNNLQVIYNDLEFNNYIKRNNYLNDLEILIIKETLNLIIESDDPVSELIEKCRKEYCRATINNVALRIALSRLSIINFESVSETKYWNSELSKAQVTFAY